MTDQEFLVAGWKPNALYAGGYQPPFLALATYEPTILWSGRKHDTTSSTADVDSNDEGVKRVTRKPVRSAYM